MNQRITKQELLEYVIKNEKKIDFVAKCKTRWHLTGVLAFIERLSKENSNISGVIFIQELSGKLFISDTDIKLPDNVCVTIIFETIKPLSLGEKINKFSNLVLSRNKDRDLSHNIYVLNPFYLDYQFAAQFLQRAQSQCTLVCIDEGVGSYRTRFDLLYYYFRIGFITGFEQICFWILDSHLKHKYNCKHILFNILSKSKNGLVKDTEACELYRRILVENTDQLKVVPNERYILVVTQPYDSKSDALNADIINKCLDKFINEYMGKRYKVYVKPHPRESQEEINKYLVKGYTLFPYSGGIEPILANIDLLPEIVLGTNSTALVTASVLFDIKSISIVSQLEGEVNRGLKSSFQAFRKLFGNIIEFV